MRSELNLTPDVIVKSLSRYIIGQERAKRAVAIAIRNRWRRMLVEEPMRSEITPNNILMIGPTGVGKTEIARRLAQLVQAPFVKVEASKFTEVGYVGRDVDSIVRDLVDVAVQQVRSRRAAEVAPRAREMAIDRVVELLVPAVDDEQAERMEHTRSRIRGMVENGKMDERTVEIDTYSRAMPDMSVFTPGGIEELGMNFQEMFEDVLPKKRRKRKVTVKEALQIFSVEAEEDLLDMEQIVEDAKRLAQETGIVFIDEIDKVIGPDETQGPNVSREGVQRDLLPLIEGANVPTKYGVVLTDHILFIAAGAFHGSRPSALIPELQGRIPIRVELDSLNASDFKRILVEPDNALTKQYLALLKTESIDLHFTDGAIAAIAKVAQDVNDRTQNIGARRLQTIMSTLLDDILFDAHKIAPKRITITKRDVERRFAEIVEDEELSHYIL